MRPVQRAGAALAACLLVVGCADSASEPGADSLAGAAAVAGASPGGGGIVGEWTLSIDTPRGVQNPTLLVTKSASSYSATYSSRQGTSFIEQVTVDGSEFSFPMQLTIPIGTIEVRYRGEVSGDKMLGFVENPRGQVPFTGSRSG